MAHCYYHALSSVRKWGGTVDHSVPLHQWFDQSKGIVVDPRHRALRHDAEGIFMLETRFGATLVNADDRTVPVRLIGEQHVREDLVRSRRSPTGRGSSRPAWMQPGHREDEAYTADGANSVFAGIVPAAGLPGARHRSVRIAI